MFCRLPAFCCILFIYFDPEYSCGILRYSVVKLRIDTGNCEFLHNAVFRSTKDVVICQRIAFYLIYNGVCFYGRGTCKVNGEGSVLAGNVDQLKDNISVFVGADYLIGFITCSSREAIVNIEFVVNIAFYVGICNNYF